MFRSRSFLMDLLVVGLACFSIIFAIWPDPPLGQPVTMRLSDGTQKSVLLAPDSKELESIRESLRQAGRTPISASYAMSLWKKETSELYAARQPDSISNSKTGVMQTVSHRSSVLDWSDHWQQKVAQCAAEIQSQHAQANRRGLAMAARIRLETVTAAAPRPAAWACGYIVAIAAMVISYFWREWQPVKTLPILSDSQLRKDDRVSGEPLTPLVFRTSWVRAVQPIGVRLRGTVAGILILAAITLVIRKHFV